MIPPPPHLKNSASLRFPDATTMQYVWVSDRFPLKRKYNCAFFAALHWGQDRCQWNKLTCVQRGAIFKEPLLSRRCLHHLIRLFHRSYAIKRIFSFNELFDLSRLRRAPGQLQRRRHLSVRLQPQRRGRLPQEIQGTPQQRHRCAAETSSFRRWLNPWRQMEGFLNPSVW